MAALISFSSAASAAVSRIEIKERSPFADGHRFGTAGTYERISGRLHMVVDPADPAQSRIADLRFAPRNADGLVEFWSDFFLLKPVDPAKGNRRLLFDVHNRGNKLAVWTFNRGPERTNDPRTLEHAGDGFLMHRGYSILWCGWSGEVVDDGSHRLLAGLPIAVNPDGSPITGPAHVEICVTEEVKSRTFSWSPWGSSLAFPPADTDPARASLTMREDRESHATEIPTDSWSYGRWEDGRLIPDPTSVYLEDGFKPGYLYDLLYTAKDPRVSGLGLAAVRDAIAFFKHAEPSTPTGINPLASSIEQSYIFGISQAGRVVHHFIYDGFNTDEDGRQVFDGALIHVSGSGKGMFNHRFRMSTDYGTYHEGHFAASEFFPLSPATQTDPVTGESGDTLARARASGHVPKTIFVQSSTEYWNRGASLLHTDVRGERDINLPEEVRLYLVAGSQHLGASEHTPGTNQQPRNTLDDRGPILRAMLDHLDRWASGDKPPPPSRYPRIEDGTLVDLPTFISQFPEIPGVNLPAAYYHPPRLDFGPRLQSEGIADRLPPLEGEPFTALVPAVDSDGNEIAGIRLPDVEVPLGTFTGWNIRAEEFGAGGIISRLDGMYLPFPDATSSDDPRPSIAERYSSRSEYLARVTEATIALRDQGFLLDEDAIDILKKAASRFE
jgi:hypothetical protein